MENYKTKVLEKRVALITVNNKWGWIKISSNVMTHQSCAQKSRSSNRSTARPNCIKVKTTIYEKSETTGIHGASFPTTVRHKTPRWISANKRAKQKRNVNKKSVDGRRWVPLKHKKNDRRKLTQQLLEESESKNSYGTIEKLGAICKKRTPKKPVLLGRAKMPHIREEKWPPLRTVHQADLDVPKSK